MEKQDEIKSLFYDNGCLTPEGIFAFIGGETVPESNEKIKAHLAGCELCREAVEGYRLLEELKPGTDPKKEITGLQERILLRAKEEKVLSAVKKPAVSKYIYLAAAGFILIIGLTFILMLNRENTTLPEVVRVSKENKNVTADTHKGIALVTPEKKEVPLFPGKKPSRVPYAIEDITEQEHVPAEKAEEAVLQTGQMDEFKDMVTVTVHDTVKNVPVAAGEEVSEKPIIVQEAKTDVELTEKTVSKAATSKRKGQRETVPETKSSDIPPVYTVVDEMPSFPGGGDSLIKYLTSSIKYPKIAADKGIQGTVMVSFVVQEDGSIKDVSVVKSLEKSCDEEVVRVVKSMPKWKPGVQAGKKVQTKMILPVKINLNK